MKLTRPYWIDALCLPIPLTANHNCHFDCSGITATVMSQNGEISSFLLNEYPGFKKPQYEFLHANLNRSNGIRINTHSPEPAPGECEPTERKPKHRPYPSAS